jgi:endonuclease/exonuclease/phosphatase family metal-dependent hydrolase
VKVITYNLHKGLRGKRSILREAAQELAAREPDLVFCQEVFHDAREEQHQSHVLTDTLGHGHVFGPNSFYQRGCHGNATFCYLPVGHSVNVDMTESYFEKRGMLCAQFEGEHGAFVALNVHFSLTGRQRRRQWWKLVSALPSDPKVPVIAAGDFNDWSGALDRHAMRSGLIKNALWSARREERLSFPARRPVLALDRIYYRGFRLRSAQVLTGLPWSRLSDHLPVEAVLEPE